jgi:hypothetical protein
MKLNERMDEKRKKKLHGPLKKKTKTHRIHSQTKNLKEGLNLGPILRITFFFFLSKVLP